MPYGRGLPRPGGRYRLAQQKTPRGAIPSHPRNARMFIEKLLHLMAEKKASDIFISAGSPISIKITGQIMPVNPAPMDAEMTKKIAYEMLTPLQIETFEREQELNFSKPIAGLGNFRVNLFWSKGAVSGVI